MEQNLGIIRKPSEFGNRNERERQIKIQVFIGTFVLMLSFAAVILILGPVAHARVLLYTLTHIRSSITKRKDILNPPSFKNVLPVSFFCSFYLYWSHQYIFCHMVNAL